MARGLPISGGGIGPVSRRVCGIGRLLAIAVVVGSTGCGGHGGARVAVTVGPLRIDQSAVKHWTDALVADGPALTLPRRAGQTSRSRALDFLISANWLIGEAAKQGASISSTAVGRRLKELREAVPGDTTAFVESLVADHRTVADVELEIRASLAAAAIRRILMRTYGRVSEAAIVRYYERIPERFRVPEHRDVDIVEHLKSPAAARRLALRVGSGAQFAARAYQETRQRPQSFDAKTETGRLERAIFRARPGALEGPKRLAGAWALFVVRRVQPATTRSLATVRTLIAKRLSARALARATTTFFESYRSRWRATTSCRPGYVISRCREYVGPTAQEDPFAGT
jgi:hypothetical protein